MAGEGGGGGGRGGGDSDSTRGGEGSRGGGVAAAMTIGRAPTLSPPPSPLAWEVFTLCFTAAPPLPAPAHPPSKTFPALVHGCCGGRRLALPPLSLPPSPLGWYLPLRILQQSAPRDQDKVSQTSITALPVVMVAAPTLAAPLARRVTTPDVVAATLAFT